MRRMLTRFFLCFALLLLLNGQGRGAGLFLGAAMVCGLLRLLLGYKAHWL